MQPSRRPGRPGRPWQASGHDVPGAGRAVTACDQAPSRPGMPGGPRPAPGRRGCRLPGTPGAYWGHGPGHRDNPRRDPRHLACRHGCGRDLRDTQDVCHHRADRDGRFHRGVARGQAPQRRLARRSRRGRPVRPLRGGIRPGRTLRAAGWTACRATGYPRAITRPGMSMATNETHPAVTADSGNPSVPRPDHGAGLLAHPPARLPPPGRRARPCAALLDPPLWRADRAGSRRATPADTALAPADLEDAPHPPCRLGARGPSGESVTHGAHISHSSAQSIQWLGKV